jgi:hypothetical protein
MFVSAYVYMYSVLHTDHSRFILEEVPEASQIVLRDTHVLPKLLSYEEYCRRVKW